MKLDHPFHHALTRRDFLAGAACLGAFGAVRAWAAPLPVAGIDHVNLHVPDVDRTAAFYTKLFADVVSRSPKAKAQTANPDSPSGVLWFVKTGENNLAISPTRPGQEAGLDHYCLAIRGFRQLNMKSEVAGLNRLWPDSSPSQIWLKDPEGNTIQLNAGANPSRVPGAGVGGVLVEPPGGVPRKPAFQAVRITRLTLAVRDLNSASAYYRKLLGDNAEKAQRGTFRVGPSELVLGPLSGGDSFRVAVMDFAPDSAIQTLKNLGIASEMAPDGNFVSFRDPDGIHVEISE